MKKKNTLYIQFNFLQMLVFPNVRLSMTTFYINSAMNKYDEIKRLNFLRFISTQMMGQILHSSFLPLKVPTLLFSFVCLEKVFDKIMSKMFNCEYMINESDLRVMSKIKVSVTLKVILRVNKCVLHVFLKATLCQVLS